ncbi:MAG: hypothetical protein ACP5SB_00415 [Caldisericaceae bacterium]
MKNIESEKLNEAIKNLKLDLTGSYYIGKKKVSEYAITTKINGVRLNLTTTIGYPTSDEDVTPEELQELIDAYEQMAKEDLTANPEKLAQLIELSVAADAKPN